MFVTLNHKSFNLLISEEALAAILFIHSVLGFPRFYILVW